MRPTPLRASVLIQVDLAAQKIVGIDEAVDQSCVGYRGFAAPQAVAHGPGIGAGAIRPYGEQTAGIHPGQAAAAGADRPDVHARQQQGISQQFGLPAHQRRAVLDQADVETGAAHIHDHHIGHLDGRGDMGCSGHPANGPAAKAAMVFSLMALTPRIPLGLTRYSRPSNPISRSRSSKLVR